MRTTELATNLTEVYDELMRATERDVRRDARRRRASIAGVVLALFAATTATAIARGWILDSGLTLAQISQVRSETPTAVEFAPMIRTGQLKNPVELPRIMAIPAGSIYAGTLIRRADGDDNFTCVKATAGFACGYLSAASPTVGGIISYPASKNLPSLAYGAIGPNVESVTVTCANGTYPATFIGGRVYAAVLPLGTDADHCTTSWK